MVPGASASAPGGGSPAPPLTQQSTNIRQRSTAAMLAPVGVWRCSTAGAPARIGGRRRDMSAAPDPDDVEHGGDPESE